MNLKYSTLLFSVCLTASLASCGGKEEEKEAVTEPTMVDTTQETLNNEQEELNEVGEFKFHVFIANLPSPLESMLTVNHAGIPGDKSLVNPVDHADRYNTLAKKALNYGVYGTDMAYLAVYDMTQEVTDYFATVKSLAEEIGAANQFSQVLTERFQANLNNNDSLVILMDNALGATDEYLKNNQRMELACLAMTGSWVESQHIMVNALLTPGVKGDLTKLNEAIVAQKNHLKSLIDLLGEQPSADCKRYKAELAGLKSSYDSINGPSDVTESKLKEIAGKIKRLRDKIIQ